MRTDTTTTSSPPPLSTLLALLRVHLSLDNSISPSTSLPHYSPLIASLLKKLKRSGKEGDGKLLSVLESHPDTFAVTRNASSPDTVTLLPSSSPITLDKALSSVPALSVVIQEKEEAVAARCLVALRRYEGKCRRRGTVSEPSSSACPNHLQWLASQVAPYLHSLLRLRGFYYAHASLTALSVATPEWIAKAAPLLEEMLGNEEGEFGEWFDFSFSDDDPPVRLVAVSSIAPPPPPPSLPSSPPPSFSPTLLLTADEEGLFSVTSSKAAASMSSLLLRVHSESTATPPYSCVDLTAGVGGLALQLRKKFGAVVACEIDADRHAILSENVARKEASVVCVCCDGMAAFSPGGPGEGLVLPAAVLDPPWGGVGWVRGEEVRFAGRSLGEVAEELKVRPDLEADLMFSLLFYALCFSSFFLLVPVSFFSPSLCCLLLTLSSFPPSSFAASFAASLPSRERSSPSA